MVLGPLISAGANIVGGIIGSNNAKDTNRAAAEQAELNRQMQLQFAQNSIKWKVKDAQDAGIHPLYAVGAPTSTYSPVSLGQVQDTSLPAAIANTGQDLSRAINATRTAPERLAAVEQTRLGLESLKLDNDIKRATLASSLQRIAQSSNPPMPTIGDGAVPTPRPRPDSLTPFNVPEASKSEERPPLMLWGQRVLTPPGTSPMKAWEDQIGDDGPLSWLAQMAVGAHMLQHNIQTRFPNGSMPWDSWYDRFFRTGRRRSQTLKGG